MDNFTLADIFFFIASVAVVVFSGLLIAALVFLLQIFRDIRRVLHKVREETELLAQDISGIRQVVRQKGPLMWHVVKALEEIYLRHRAKAEKKPRAKKRQLKK